ncbi:hypothetical protein [Halomicrococcus sp. NG-SE-24]|uniref:hypothetical protein n=1 Tax=Halomicrococcus sp. NG-SE-24 TaxID=3436928 RepID=UPI003D9773D9
MAVPTETILQLDRDTKTNWSDPDYMNIPYQENIQRVLDDPSSLHDQLLAAGMKIHRRLGSYYVSGEPLTIMDAEWDNLLILDACRYDMFESHHSFPGTLKKVRSAGSQSREFLEYNFSNKEYHDTVYVTANPFAATLDDGTFHAVIDLFDEAWDEELLTVRPESVVDATLQANEEYPNKRIISHFMQPHYPFIGEQGQQIDTGGVTGNTVRTEGKTRADATSIWSRLETRDNSLSESAVWDAYVENFKLVETHAKTLFKELDGKSVVTSDHGNLFGKRLWPIPLKKYGHPPGLRFDELVQVPWHEPPFDERRQIESNPPEESSSVADDVVEERLKNLGYA